MNKTCIFLVSAHFRPVRLVTKKVLRHLTVLSLINLVSLLLVVFIIIYLSPRILIVVNQDEECQCENGGEQD